jgi:hypothetical protein
MSKASFDKLPAEVYHAIADFLLDDDRHYGSLRLCLPLRLICPALTSVISQRIVEHIAGDDLTLDTHNAFGKRDIPFNLAILKWRDVQCTVRRVSFYTDGYWWTTNSQRQLKKRIALLHTIRATVEVLNFSSYMDYNSGYRLPKARSLPALQTGFSAPRYLKISTSTLSILPALLANSPDLQAMHFSIPWAVIQDHLQVYPELATAFSSVGAGSFVLERLFLGLDDHENDLKVMAFIDSWSMHVNCLDIIIITRGESRKWERLATLIQTSRILRSCSIINVTIRGIQAGKQALFKKLGKEDQRIRWNPLLDDWDAEDAAIAAATL